MANSEIDLAALISRLEKLEERYNIVARYAMGVKRQLDDLTQQFNARPELQTLEDVKKAIAQLSEGFTHMQKLSNPSSTTATNSNNIEPTDAPTQPEIITPSETVQQFFERVEQQEREQLLNLEPIPQTNELEIVLDDPVDESVVIEDFNEVSNRGFSNEEFKIERMLWLLNKFYAIESVNQNIPIDAEEFWKRHNQNQVDFKGLNLAKIDLSGKSLSSQVDFSEAYLYQANLSKTNLIQAKFIKAILNDADLSNSCLFGVNFEDGNLEGANLKQAIFNSETIFPERFDPIKAGAYLIAPGSKLQKANLANTDLSGLNLTKANLYEADLSESNLSKADLSKATLQQGNLTKVNLSSAKLLQADLSYSKLNQGILCGANLIAASLQGANLTQADLRNANLAGANLSYANLTQSNLNSTNLAGANLYSANLSNAKIDWTTRLKGANLYEVNFLGLSLEGLDMSGGDLRSANLCGTNLVNANLSGVYLTSADLRGADLDRTNLEKANLKNANIAGANITPQTKLKGAIMPDGTIHE